MVLYRILSHECSSCLIVKEMTRRVLSDYPELSVEDVDVDLEPQRAMELIPFEDRDPAVFPGLPIPYLKLGNHGLYSPTKMQQIRDFLQDCLSKDIHPKT